MGAEIQTFAFPRIKVVGNSNGAIYSTEAFFRGSHTVVLAKCLGAFDGRLVGAGTLAHFISAAVTLIGAVACATTTGGRVIRTVTFDDVILD